MTRFLSESSLFVRIKCIRSRSQNLSLRWIYDTFKESLPSRQYLQLGHLPLRCGKFRKADIWSQDGKVGEMGGGIVGQVPRLKNLNLPAFPFQLSVQSNVNLGLKIHSKFIASQSLWLASIFLTKRSLKHFTQNFFQISFLVPGLERMEFMLYISFISPANILIGIIPEMHAVSSGTVLKTEHAYRAILLHTTLSLVPLQLICIAIS